MQVHITDELWMLVMGASEVILTSKCQSKRKPMLTARTCAHVFLCRHNRWQERNVDLQQLLNQIGSGMLPNIFRYLHQIFFFECVCLEHKSSWGASQEFLHFLFRLSAPDSLLKPETHSGLWSVYKRLVLWPSAVARQQVFFGLVFMCAHVTACCRTHEVVCAAVCASQKSFPF